jgi:calcium-dependent protein kinase
MGCFPIRKKNSIDIDNQSSKVNIEDTRPGLKITEGMLVQGTEGDPYEFYEETKLLGEGAFGKVFKVFHKITKAVRAMKIINKQKAELGSEEEKALINEINILKSLDHPNIIKVYEYYNTKRRLFIISELCTGGELFDKISQDKFFNEKLSAHVMKQLISAVQFCHANGIIHRDLKPENILIESQEEAKKEYFTIKVIDFGTSDKIRKNKLMEKQIGTPFYIAPEVLNNAYNEKCDLWSCGVILYILLSGVPPFYGDTEEQIYARVKEGKYSMDGTEWEDISPEAKDLLKNLLKKEINKRFSAEQAMNHIWFKKMKEIMNFKEVSKENLNRLAVNLKNFRANQKLQQATLAYIVHNLTKKEDVEELRKVFMEFDENGDGRLTKDELIKGLNKVMTPQEAVSEVNRIMDLIDVDGNGFIEYEEFLRASLNKEKILTQDNLKIVFNMFDKDKSGKITPQELKNVLGKDSNISDDVWKEIVGEIDGNGDGEISFNEFKQMMAKVADVIHKENSSFSNSLMDKP